jgi:site-specific DNA-methyltransferase (adenine-specific)
MNTVQLHHGDCLDLLKSLPDGSVDAVVTDPPYPDYYTDEFRFDPRLIECLRELPCRQFVFWSAKADFPLPYTARHVWDKITGAVCRYDFIYERNGGKRQTVYRGHRINSTVSAQFASEKFTGHKSQKPLNVMRELVEAAASEGCTVLDPFMGSGTTGVACVNTGRNFIGVEIDKGYYEIAQRRIAEAQAKRAEQLIPA